MKFLKSWLQDYIDIEYSNEELRDLLVSAGLETEIVSGRNQDQNIIAATIEKILPHPNADRLKIVEVSTGAEQIVVVCGANNIKVGQTVPLAKIGAQIQGSVVRKAKIRGIESSGMLCSAFELGISKDHTGIKILEKDSKLGEAVLRTADNDTVFDLEITPNRGDCLSHIGIAREIAAMSGEEVKKTPIKLKMSDQTANSVIDLHVKKDSLCPRYMARVIKGVKIGVSPEWLIARLNKVGLKSINNIVDITNYIMLDLGQPLHAFDYQKIDGKKIVVRMANQNEKIISLDQEQYQLSTDMLVIADENKPIALAGIIGSTNSEIDHSTKDIVIEAASFDSKSIRKTRTKLNISTEASYRFERSVDESAVQYALDKAASMIKEIAGGTILSGIAQFAKDIPEKRVKIEYVCINKLLGTHLSKDEIDQILKSFGFNIQNGDAAVPSYRHDITVWQDLAEEVAKLYGYGNIPEIKLSKSNTRKISDYHFKEALKDILVSTGCVETISYPFFDNSGFSDEQTLLRLSNPVQPENKFMRGSLIYGLYKTVSQNNSFDPVALFEIGQVFTNKSEKTHLAIVVAGNSRPVLVIEEQIRSLLKNFFKPAINIEFQELDKTLASKFKIRKQIVKYLEIEINDIKNQTKVKRPIYKLINNTVVYRKISKFPAVTRDLSFVVSKSQDVTSIIAAIYETDDRVFRVELFDQFTSDKIGNDKKSLAFHIQLQDYEKTLKDEEGDQIIECIVSKLKVQHKAILRS